MTKNDDNWRRATLDTHEDIVQVNTQKKNLNVTCTWLKRWLNGRSMSPALRGARHKNIGKYQNHKSELMDFLKSLRFIGIQIIS